MTATCWTRKCRRGVISSQRLLSAARRCLWEVCAIRKPSLGSAALPTPPKASPGRLGGHGSRDMKLPLGRTRGGPRAAPAGSRKHGRCVYGEQLGILLIRLLPLHSRATTEQLHSLRTRPGNDTARNRFSCRSCRCQLGCVPRGAAAKRRSGEEAAPCLSP